MTPKLRTLIILSLASLGQASTPLIVDHFNRHDRSRIDTLRRGADQYINSLAAAAFMHLNSQVTFAVELLSLNYERDIEFGSTTHKSDVAVVNWLLLGLYQLGGMQGDLADSYQKYVRDPQTSADDLSRMLREFYIVGGKTYYEQLTEIARHERAIERRLSVQQTLSGVWLLIFGFGLVSNAFHVND